MAQYKSAYTGQQIDTAIDTVYNLAEVATSGDYNDLINTPPATVETDPTVPAWAKASTKPTYDADEVGFSGTTGYITENATDVEMAINSLDVAVQNTVSSVNGASGDVVTTFYVIFSGNATDGYTANKTFAEVESVIDAGYTVCAQYGTSIYHLILKTSAGMSFSRASSNQLATFTWAKSTNKINLTYTNHSSVSDVQVNGTSILNNKVANLVTNTAYDATTNKIATMSDVGTMTIRTWSGAAS